MEMSISIGTNSFSMFGELEQYFDQFRQNTIGHGQIFQTPYGEFPLIYADWTASGRLYKPIENKLLSNIAPFYANPHSEETITGKLTTAAYEKARQVIKKHVNARESDILICEGSGTTAAVNKLQRILGLRLPDQLISSVNLPMRKRPVVFVTHMEHHSNEISWRETIADVVQVRPNKEGLPDLGHLEELLQRYENREAKIGAFTACSNVTGIMTPYHEMARILHKYNGVCFIDFATSAPYVDIDMHPSDEEKLDAIYFSCHKMLGGPGGTGVLIFCSSLYNRMTPDHPGGGTVLWTNPWGKHQYLSNIEKREDGGTPPVLQTIKASYAIQLKEQMGSKHMYNREKELIALLLDNLVSTPGIYVFAAERIERLGIVSFVAKDIHYNLFVKLLNDRYGIQARGGCSCAGPYGHYLFSINKQSSKLMTDYLDQGEQSAKVGWVRLSIHPTMTNYEIYTIINAIKEIMKFKDKWCDDYVYNEKTNHFTHKKELVT
ncbi:aminotransferase class V-fold PLP-dependent enzyme [Bacillus sp. HMF5848]|uniref:aminotransferase class V-fold PLP-dependent enzyme n=1 Tax=Bacillus sp. HMF5848 TaxID=2495421 RepID=UPI000F792237|nr:aminotransferase class V-fold PLP-dependent enzyme [Bacillus sp. HMF5848]RSK26825.1 aminotransferase class V-fold PLP-dependent enzyme [Bacillus sp. HMF5848]